MLQVPRTMSKILGIDLGTTFSAMAVVINGEAKIIENKEGARTTHSIVALSKTGERTVGVLAKRQAVTNPHNTIYSVKRLIGRKFSDAEVQRDKKLMPYEIRESSDGGVDVKIHGSKGAQSGPGGIESLHQVSRDHRRGHALRPGPSLLPALQQKHAVKGAQTE